MSQIKKQGIFHSRKQQVSLASDQQKIVPADKLLESEFWLTSSKRNIKGIRVIL